MNKTIKNLALYGLATYGALSLLSGVPQTLIKKIDPTYRNHSGSLANGLKYTIKSASPNHQWASFRENYFITFGDGITVEDGFRDGALFCYDINNSQGLRVASKKIIESNTNLPYCEGTYIVDDNLRSNVIERVQEVYHKENIPTKVIEGD